MEIEKKLCEVETQIPTKQEVNINQINLTIFDLFMSNIDITKLKKNLIIDSLNTKDKYFYNEKIYLDEELTNKYLKWLNRLLKHIENNNKKVIKITKIERLLLKYYEDVIYDSDDWELIEYKNEKIS